MSTNKWLVTVANVPVNSMTVQSSAAWSLFLSSQSGQQSSLPSSARCCPKVTSHQVFPKVTVCSNRQNSNALGSFFFYKGWKIDTIRIT